MKSEEQIRKEVIDAINKLRKDEDEASWPLLKALFIFIGTILIIVPLTLLNGYTISILWTWFVSEPFGLIKIGVLHGSGLAILVRYATLDLSNKHEAENGWALILKCVTVPVFTLGIGYILHWFM